MMTNTIPAVVPPLPHEGSLNRHYAPAVAFHWFALGWRDLLIRPAASLLYGLAVFVGSAAVAVGLFAFGWDVILFPAFAGFMVVGPILAIGLYEKSRRLATGEPVSLTSMIRVHPASGGQILYRSSALSSHAIVDAGHGNYLCLVLRAAAVSRPAAYCGRPVQHSDRVGAAVRRYRCRRPVCRLLLRHQRLLDIHAA